MNKADFDEVRRAQLRWVAEQAVHELCENVSRGGAAAEAAALALVGIAISAAEAVRSAAWSSPGVFANHAAQMTRWPIVHSLFPGDENGVCDYLAKLHLGSKVRLNFRNARLTAPGVRWALSYWIMVGACRQHQKLERELTRCDSWFGEDVRLFSGAVVKKGDYDDALALPAMTTANLAKWRAAFKAYLLRYYPGHSVLEHADWRHVTNYKIGRGNKAGLAFNKVLGEIGRGFERIAAAPKPARRKKRVTR